MFLYIDKKIKKRLYTTNLIVSTKKYTFTNIRLYYIIRDPFNK